ncbi:MAG: polysaccharide deacetylase family protein [Peptococcaceae bacterium]|nr:polysaccharide deacetylase family protein [Peptococcaceae bacterium]
MVISLVGDLIQYLAFAIVVYDVLPTLLARICSFGVISRLPVKAGVTITFDDGPDPRYTPRVLDILRAAGVKACFFVVGEKARRHPEIIKKIFSDGHEIGIHGSRHSIPWLLGPVGTFREIKESARVIKEITGSRPAAFRPPWGLFNLFSYLSSLALKQKVVLWSFMSWDWTGSITPESIKRRVQKKITNGSILVFHDSDTEPGASGGSTEKMLSALPGIIDELKQQGYNIIPLGKYINWGHSCLQRNTQTSAGVSPFLNCSHRQGLLPGLWRWWDKMFRLALKIKDITADDGSPTIFRASLRRYTGVPVELPGGETIYPGEKICELHINNDYMAEYLKGETDPGRLGIRIVRELRRSLPALAAHISRDPMYSDVKSVVGITILHRATAAMGFTAVEIPSPLIKKVISSYQSMILNLYHPSGKDRLAGKGDLSPKIVAISKSILITRYLAY